MSGPHTLLNVEQSIADYRERIKEEQEASAMRLQGLRGELGLAVERRALILVGIDTEKVLLASHVMYKHGRYLAHDGDIVGLLADLTADLVAGGGRLRHDYFGLKNYDGWLCQRSDHPYGTGPSHGHIVFAIGVHKVIRDRVGEPMLSPEEAEACLYWVGNLGLVQAAEDAGKAAEAAGAM